MSEVEARFLAMIRETPDDDTPRLVYADWLEGNGDHERADFLRTLCKLGRPDLHKKKAVQLQARLVKIARPSDAAWRSLVARPPVEYCPVEFRFKCPKRWTALTPTDRDDVRHCGACERDVYFCASLDEVRRHATLGDCVAFDPVFAGAAHVAYERARPLPAGYDGLEIEIGEVA